MMYKSASSFDLPDTKRNFFASQQWGRRLPSNHGSRSSIKWQSNPDSSAHQELAISPGQVINSQHLEVRRARRNLKQAIDFFRSQGNDLGKNQEFAVSETSRLAAHRFIELLPFNIALPKVAPDGETGVMFYWSLQGRDVVITVDQNLLHCVVGAGTRQATYHEDLVFDGNYIPETLLGAIQE